MKTKNNSQKIVSAKILAKLLELATKFVIPCIKTSTPGKYTAKEIWEGKDSFGNNLWWSIDEEHNGDELSVAITAEDFTAEEMAILGYEPIFRLQIKLEKIFYAISKYEQLASVRGNNVAKFVVGEPATIYETERAKVTIYDRESDMIVTKTKKITIISDTQSVYRQDKKTITLCLKINGKWFAVHTLSMVAYDFETIVENVLKKYTIDNIRKGVKATANSQVCNKFVEFCRLIQSELDSMDKLNAEAAKAQAADNVTADSEGNANVATENASKANAEAKVSAEIQSTAEGDKCSGGDDVRKQADAPKNKESAPPEQSKREKTKGREIADLSEFCGRSDKRYHPSGENRNMGIYCGKNEVLSAEARGSPQSAATKSIHNSN